MTRRGFTLLEVLISLALLLAIAALCLPSLRTTLQERRFEAAADQALHHLLLARVHAQSTGVPVEVTYLADPPRLEATLFEPGQRAMDEDELTPVRPDDSAEEPTELFLLEDEIDPANRIPESWAHQALPEDLIILDEKPDPPGMIVDPSDLWVPEQWAEPIGPDAGPPEPVRIRVAVYLPDGSALLGKPVWLTDSVRRLGRLAVNPWTGLPSFERDEDWASAATVEPDVEAQEEESADEAVFDEGDLADDSSAPSAGEPEADSAETTRPAESGDGRGEDESDEMNEEEP